MLKEYDFEDIYIRHAIDDEPSDTNFTMHIHEQCEIYFYLSGNIEYLVEGSVYPLESSCLMLMRPSEVHKAKITGSEKYERYAINFPTSFLSEFDPKGRLLRAFFSRPLGKNNLINESSLDINLIKKLFSEMFDNYEDEYDRQLAIKTRLITMLDLICNAFDKQGKNDSKPLSTAEKIIIYTNNHIFEPITVPELASHFYLSTSHFNRIFRKATGASPWEYITKKRLTAAKEKIHNQTPAYEACESCGFKDYSSFYRAYTKHFGCAPTDNS